MRGNSRLRFLRVFFAVNRVMQHAIDVMKDRVLGDRPPSFSRKGRRVRPAFVMRFELFEHPAGDVVDAGAVVGGDPRPA